MHVPLWGWLVFGGVVAVMLTVDLLAHRSAHVIGFRESAIWSAIWVAVSLLFAGVSRSPWAAARPSTSPPRTCSRRACRSTTCSSSR